MAVRVLSTGVLSTGALAALLLAGTGPATAQEGGQAPVPNPLAPRTSGPQPTLAPEAEGRKPPPPDTREEPIEEIEIIAPRRTAPDFQTVDEFYRAEFEKIRGEFENPAAPPPRDYEVFESGGMAESPNTRSTVRDMIRNAPSARETLSRNPPKADPTPR